MEEKRISKLLIRRIKNLYERTDVTVRTKKEMTKIFRITKEVRQGYVLSPLLFNLYIADMDKYMKRRGIGGIIIDNERLWSLAYADDMVLIAKNREALLDMMSVLKRFLRDRGLILNVEKTKVLVFNRKRKEKKEKWKLEKEKKKREERYRARKKWRKRVGNIRINNS